MTPDAFQAETGASDAAIEALRIYADELARWQRRINLIGRGTLPDVWRRHFLDSAQLAPFLAGLSGPVADLGSGAGFPGMVLAILGLGPVVLVEADARKAVFLREIARLTSTEVEIVNERIESAPPIGAGAVVSRALAPLDRLLDLARPHLRPGGRCVFLKGGAVDEELTQARKRWMMDISATPSITDPTGTVLIVKQLAPRTHA